jgi:hypothetical protein
MAESPIGVLVAKMLLPDVDVSCASVTSSEKLKTTTMLNASKNQR